MNLSKKSDDNQSEMSFTALFNGPVFVEKKMIAVLGFSCQWCIVRSTGDIPRYLPTKMSSRSPFSSYLRTNLLIR